MRLYAPTALVALALAAPAGAQSYTWNGAGGSNWNFASNWTPSGIPDATSESALFDNTATTFGANISSSVAIDTLRFANLFSSNPSFNHTLTSSAGQTLTVSSIVVDNTVSSFAVQTINLANVSSGSLRWTGTLRVSNNSTLGSAANLVIGPNTVLGTTTGTLMIFEGTGHTELSGSIAAQALNLSKDGPGTLTIKGTNSSSGSTFLDGGLLVADYSTNATSKLGSGSLNLSGSELRLNAHATSTFSEIVSSTGFSRGHSTIRTDTNGGTLAAVTLNLAALSGNADTTVNFVIDTGSNLTTSTATSSGILGGRYTVNSADWASKSGSNIVPLAAYSTNTYGLGLNTAVTSAGAVAPSNFTTHSLRFGDSTQTQFGLVGTNTVQSGGLLVPPTGPGNLTIHNASFFGGDELTSANPLYFHLHRSAGMLTVSGGIDAPNGIVKTGVGTLVLSGSKLGLTGPIHINQGDLTITSTSAVNSSSGLSFNDTRGTAGQFFRVQLGDGTTGTVSRAITASAGPNWRTVLGTGTSENSRVTFSGVISSTSGLTTPISIDSPSTSGINLIGTNTFTGDVFLYGGTLGIASNAALGNAANRLQFMAGSATAGGLEFLANGTDLARPVVFNSTGRVVVNGTNLNTISGTISGFSELVKAGMGTLVLSGTNAHSTTQIREGTLRIAADANLGTNYLWINGATLNTTATTSGNRTIYVGPQNASGSGTVDVNAGTTLTWSGAVLNASFGTGTLVKDGFGTLVLSGTNGYSGGTMIRRGTLQVGADAGLGAAAGPVTVEALGTLAFGATTTTGRHYTLNGGTLAANSGAVVTLSNLTVSGGFLAGPGTFATASAGSSTFAAATAANSATISTNGADSFVNFSNGGQLTVTPGMAATLTRFTNTSSGRLTVSGGTANVSDFTSNGLLTITPFATMTNVGTSSMVLGGGSRTFIGNVGGDPLSNGLLDVRPSPLLVNGGLLVNNGRVRNTGTQVIVDYGGYATGDGIWSSNPVTQNGGKSSVGNSPGRGTFGQFTMNPGGIWVFEINNATGIAGPTGAGAGSRSGWDLAVVQDVDDPAQSNLNVTATPANPFKIELVTLTNPSPPDVAGAMANFNPNQRYDWLAFDVHPSGTVTNWNPAAITLDRTGVSAANFASGDFSLSRVGHQVFVTYQPVPEPASVLAVLLGGAAGAGWWRRRVRSSEFGVRSSELGSRELSPR